MVSVMSARAAGRNFPGQPFLFRSRTPMSRKRVPSAFRALAYSNSTSLDRRKCKTASEGCRTRGQGQETAVLARVGEAAHMPHALVYNRFNPWLPCGVPECPSYKYRQKDRRAHRSRRLLDACEKITLAVGWK